MASSPVTGTSGEIVKADEPPVTTPPNKKYSGRVWRRNNDDENVGPVLRTNVKPVKRFRPDCSPDKGNPSPGRKKKAKTNKDVSGSTASGEKNSSSTAVFVKSPSDGKTKKSRNKVSSGKAEPPGDGVPKKKRVWEQWTLDDKNCFFDAVAMHGKDFEAVTAAVASRHKKRGEDGKTKEQVRHLYYRTWTTISKLIKKEAYPAFTNRAFREMAAVINYGELHKRLGGTLSMKKKAVEKLNELMRYGTTILRIKGKNFRVKTPNCQALKKIENQKKTNSLNHEVLRETRRVKLPVTIPIELRPLDLHAWTNVQSTAQNPRLRVNVPTHRPVSFLFEFLTKKWSQSSLKACPFAVDNGSKNQFKIDKLTLQTLSECNVESCEVASVTKTKSHCIVTYYVKKVEKKGTEKVEPEKEEVTLQEDKPLPVSKKNNKEEVDVQNDLETSTNNLETNQSDDCMSMTSQEDSIDDCSNSPKPNQNVENKNEDVVNDNDFIANISLDETIVDLNLTLTEESTNHDSNAINHEEPLIHEIPPVECDNENVTLLPDIQESSENSNDCNNVAVEQDKPSCEANKVEVKKKRKRRRVFKTTKTLLSWSSASSEHLTFAELFIMLGKPTVVKLCYKWHTAESTCTNNAKVEPKSNTSTTKASSSLKALLQLSKVNMDMQNSRRPSSTMSGQTDNNTSPPKSKQSAKPKIKLKDTAIQCDLLKAKKITARSESLPVTTNPRGRGVNKFVTVASEFAIPRAPSRYKPLVANQKSSPTKTFSEEALKRLLRNTKKQRFYRKPNDQFQIMPRANNNHFKKMISYSIVPNSNGAGIVATPMYKTIAPKTTTQVSMTVSQNTNAKSVAQTQLVNCTDVVNTSEVFNASSLTNSFAQTSHTLLPTLNTTTGDILSLAAQQTGLSTLSEPCQIEQVDDTKTNNHESEKHNTELSTSTSNKTVTTNSTESIPYNWNEDSMSGLATQLDELANKLVNPQNDVTLTSLTTKPKAQSCPSPPAVLMSNFEKDLLETSPSKSNDMVGINMKSNDMPAHPWTINSMSREGLGLTNLLNTPQKVFPDDDSLDAYNMRKHFAMIDKTPKAGGRSPSQESNLLPENEVEMQLQCMLNENSVDYVAKFQELVQHTQGEIEYSIDGQVQEGRKT